MSRSMPFTLYYFVSRYFNFSLPVFSFLTIESLCVYLCKISISLTSQGLHWPICLTLSKPISLYLKNEWRTPPTGMLKSFSPTAYTSLFLGLSLKLVCLPVSDYLRDFSEISYLLHSHALSCTLISFRLFTSVCLLRYHLSLITMNYN
jgi:hypothetical protein